jgi:UDP-glucuronate 4-epimerase
MLFVVLCAFGMDRAVPGPRDRGEVPMSRGRSMKKVLVTGAGRLQSGSTSRSASSRAAIAVVGIDNLNAYYDVSLKEARLEPVAQCEGLRFVRADIADRASDGGGLQVGSASTADREPGGARRAWRYSIQNPRAYVEANVAGFMNILEGARQQGPGTWCTRRPARSTGSTRACLSTSGKTPTTRSRCTPPPEGERGDGHSYAHLFGIPCTGLRFFTVYGPGGAPTCALQVHSRNPGGASRIPVFNEGRMVRDFTYVDDIVEGVVRAMDHPAERSAEWNPADPDPATSFRALAPLQHRQQPAGRADDLHPRSSPPSA